MSKEKPSGDISFGDGTQIGGDFVHGDKGDKFDGDKVVGGQVKADTIEGGITQTNTVNMGAGVREHIQKIGEVLEEAAVEIDGPIQPTEGVSIEEDPAVPDDRPVKVMALASSYMDRAEAGEEITEEEQESFKANLSSSVKKYGAGAVSGLKALAPLAIAGIKATASPVFPLNVVGAVLEAWVG